MDGVEDVSEIGLWVEAVQLGGFDDRHGTCECFCTGVGPSKQPILSSDYDSPWRNSFPAIQKGLSLKSCQCQEGGSQTPLTA